VQSNRQAAPSFFLQGSNAHATLYTEPDTKEEHSKVLASVLLWCRHRRTTARQEDGALKTHVTRRDLFVVQKRTSADIALLLR
jgi:hypothetical protein